MWFLLQPCVLADIGESALQIGRQILRFGADMNGFAGGFTPQPAIEFIRRSVNAATVTGYGHSGFCPALGDRKWLTQKNRDLFLSLERRGLFN